jgi:thiamine biosynthesis lipoprotein
MKILFRLFLILCALFGTLAQFACAAQSFEAVEYLMGTRILIRFAPIPERDAEKDSLEIIDMIRSFERAAGADKEGSFCSRLAPAHGAAYTSREVYFKNEEEKAYVYPMLLEAFALARASGGAFDPLLGNLTLLWGFSGDAMRSEPPGAEEISHALAASGYKNLLWLDERGMAVKNGARLDLGAVAKGEILDQVCAQLHAWGYRQALLNFGGDVRVMGSRVRTDGDAWRIALQHPRQAQGYWGIAHLREGAVATSGDYERFFTHKGKRYHHILDPASGLPAGAVVSASVLGPRAVLTDMLSTALFVMGAERGLTLLSYPEYSEYHALFICASNETLYERMSPGFAEAAAWEPRYTQ